MEAKQFDMVAEMPCYTVVNAYEKVADDTGGAYESESTMEARFIHALYEQGYEYLKTIKTEKAFNENLRKQMEKLNRGVLKCGVFTDEEWRRFEDRRAACRAELQQTFHALRLLPPCKNLALGELGDYCQVVRGGSSSDECYVASFNHPAVFELKASDSECCFILKNWRDWDDNEE